jgi:hypothetical protein
LQSGPGWVRTFQGGRDRHAPLPPALVVHVSGPGRLGAYRGDSLVAKLERGEISGSSMDVFASTRALADYLEESEGPEEARRFALLAARGATEALEERHDLAISVLVGQVRSMAVDLLRSTGMHQAQALAALEEVAPRGSGDP